MSLEYSLSGVSGARAGLVVYATITAETQTRARQLMYAAAEHLIASAGDVDNNCNSKLEWTFADGST